MTLCIGFYAGEKSHLPFPVLKEWLCVGIEIYRSTLPQLSVVFGTFVSAQATYFPFNGLPELRGGGEQDLKMSQRSRVLDLG